MPRQSRPPRPSSGETHQIKAGYRSRLLAAALRANRLALAPFSGFNVGAALLTAKGQIISGANVESASYGLSCCAERVALFKALTEGRRSFLAVAIVAPIEGGPIPCGACRQLLAEYAPGALVWVADSRAPKKIREFTVRQLLPEPFGFARGSSVSEPSPIVQ
jgi:cytidine deaminase